MVHGESEFFGFAVNLVDSLAICPCGHLLRDFVTPYSCGKDGPTGVLLTPSQSALALQLFILRVHPFRGNLLPFNFTNLIIFTPLAASHFDSFPVRFPPFFRCNTICISPAKGFSVTTDTPTRVPAQAVQVRMLLAEVALNHLGIGLWLGYGLPVS